MNPARFFLPINVLVFVFTLCSVATPQAPDKPKDQTSKVYVWVLKGDSLPAKYEELIPFTKTLLRMQVKAFERFEAEPVQAEPDCRSRKSEERDVTADRSASSYYLIRVAIYPLKTADSDLVLDYEISKYEQCSKQVLIHRTAPFGEATAQERLGDLATSVTAVLEVGTSAQHSKKVIDVHEATGGTGNDAPQMRTSVTDTVLLSLRGENDLDPRDRRKNGSTPPADYEIQPKLFNQERWTARLSVSFKKNGIEQSYQSPEVLGPVVEKPSDANKNAYQEKLGSFYEDIAKTAFSFLNDVRFAVEAGIVTNQLSTADVALLTTKVRELMCDLPDSPAGCEPQDERAIPLLRELLTTNPNRKIRDPNLFFLLAQAYSKGEDFVRSAQAFDEASKIIGEANSGALTYLLSAAYAWYKVPNYDLAADRYDSAIRLADSVGKSQYEHHLQRIRSHHFAGKRINALNALVDSLSKFPEKKGEDLNDELKSLVDDFSGPDELAEAARIIRDNERILPGQSEIKRIHNRLADVLLDSAESEYERASTVPSAYDAAYDGMEARLNKLYGKPDSLFPLARSSGSSIDLSDEQKAKVLYLRALLYRDNAKARNLDEAEMLLNQAIKLGTIHKNWFRYELAVTHNMRALANGGAGANEAYSKAISQLEKLLKDAYLHPQSYLLLREINHKRNDDKKTKTLLLKALDESKSDTNEVVYLSRRLLGLCVDYLADFKCAMDTAHSFDKLLNQHSTLRDDIGLRMDLAEAYVLGQACETAEKHLNRIPGPPGVRLLPVLRFYQYWCGLASNPPGAEKKLESWEKAIAKLRINREPVDWTFDGALRFLQMESVGQFTIEQKTKLREMINAMSSPAAK